MFTTVLGRAAFAVAFPVTVKATSSAILNSVKKDQEQNAKPAAWRAPTARTLVTMRAPSTSTDLTHQNLQGFCFFDFEKFPGEKFGTRIPQRP